MEENMYYGSVIEDYENSNRDYPKEMFQSIISFSEIGDESRLLEIGAGPGTATDGFLDYKIELLEITEEQTEFLNNKYADYDDIRTHLTTFEEYEDDRLFDLIYSGTAFHWIDPKIAYFKAARMLKSGGTLALFWNMTFGVRGDGDYRNLQNIERSYSLCLTDPSDDVVECRKLEYQQYIYSTGLFEAPVCHELTFQRKYNAENYLSWIKSRWVKFGELSNDRQEAFIRDIQAYFRERNDSVEIEQRILLIMAKRNESDLYQFIGRNDMSMLIDLTVLSKNPYFAEIHFLNSADETIYVLDGTELYGVITPGDCIRYLSGQSLRRINRNYMSVSAGRISEETINRIFETWTNINEIPVIEKGQLSGCIKSNKRKSIYEWKETRKIIRTLCPKDIRSGFDMSDLFLSLNEDEQRQLLSKIFDSVYVDSFRKNYDMY